MDNLIRDAPLLASGALVTISLALLSLALATALGGLAAAARPGRAERRCAHPWLRHDRARGPRSGAAAADLLRRAAAGERDAACLGRRSGQHISLLGGGADPRLPLRRLSG